MTIAVYGQTVKEIDIPYITTLFDNLQRKEVELVLHKDYAKQLREHKIHLGDHDIFYNHNDLMLLNPELLLTIGGDGTILKAITLVRDSMLPIIGINLGRMGFLASIEKTKISEAIEEVLSKRFYTEDRTLLALDSNLPIFDGDLVALNDFTLHKRDTSSMITIRTYINDTLFNVYWADGIIVSTPTGSTGYSLACGGPIVFPNSGNFIITPVAPHNLNVRPVVIPDGSRISFEIEGRSENFLCTLDSRFETVTSEHRLTISKASYKIRLAHLHHITFMKTINDKLLWGLDIRN